MNIEYVSRTHPGMARETNQDAILAMPEHGIFMIADGMGGEAAGEHAAAQTVASVKTAMTDLLADPPEDPSVLEQCLIEALEHANGQVYEMSLQDPDRKGMGSTATLFCLHRDGWFVGHVGDSRAYMVRHGLVKQLTCDHTVAWELVRQGLLDRHFINEHPGRHLLTQCIGGGEPLKVEMSVGLVHGGDMFMLCSDGLNGYIDDADLIALLTEPDPDLEARADRLLQAALEGGGGDNISLVLLRPSAAGNAPWMALKGIDDNAATQVRSATDFRRRRLFDR